MANWQVRDIIKNEIIDYFDTKEEALKDIRSSDVLVKEGTNEKYYPQHWIVEPKGFTIWKKK